MVSRVWVVSMHPLASATWSRSFASTLGAGAAVLRAGQSCRVTEPLQRTSSTADSVAEVVAAAEVLSVGYAAVGRFTGRPPRRRQDRIGVRREHVVPHLDPFDEAVRAGVSVWQMSMFMYAVRRRGFCLWVGVAPVGGR